jgi:SAM-dependent methyltransferase
MADHVGADPQYEPFADEFFVHARDGLYNAHYDRPACLRLLGDVTGRKVLDVACGPGLYASELVARGAEVIGVDQSPRMVELARERVPDGEFRLHDIRDPLDFLPDTSVDAVLFALAWEYVDDRVAAFREMRRVLRPDGALVLSRMHPTSDWLRLGGSYFDVRVVEEVWRKTWHLRYWLAPLERTCEELFEAGFLIERVHEPRPTERGAEVDPEYYELLHRQPGFLAIRAVPDPRRSCRP